MRVNHDRWGDRTLTYARYQSRYLHLGGPHKLSVSVGQFVGRGSRLRLMDDTGTSAFSHLLFSLHDLDDNLRGVRPSPMSGVLLRDGDDERCVRADNEELFGWVLIEPRGLTPAGRVYLRRGPTQPAISGSTSVQVLSCSAFVSD